MFLENGFFRVSVREESKKEGEYVLSLFFSAQDWTRTSTPCGAAT